MNTEVFCLKCKKLQSKNKYRWQCSCGGLLDIRYKCNPTDFNINEKMPGMWRYADLIPAGFSNKISLNEGFTPLTRDKSDLYYKLDYLFPTGSFKDRGASVMISKLAEMNIRKIVEDSSGNAGAAISCYAARAGMECHIVVPEKTPAKIINRIKTYGANIHQPGGSRENAACFATKLADKYHYASHVFNPWFFQGTKTVAYEIWEQFGFSVPDQVIVPLGNGTLLLGIYKGFCDLKMLGKINKIPGITGVQAEGFAPLWQMHYENQDEFPECDGVKTIASGIGINRPARYRQILDAVSKTKGRILRVGEDLILKAQTNLNRKGFNVEPTSAVVEAAYLIHRELFEKTRTVLVLSGSGLITIF